MDVFALYRMNSTKPGLLEPMKEYLIANGDHMGKWTFKFGVNCLADSHDTKGYMRFIHEENPGTVIEKYVLSLSDNQKQLID